MKNDIFDDFPPIGYLLVSRMVADQKKKPKFMYREKRTKPEDSGWRIFSGEESDDYVNNPENIAISSPSTILKQDASIANLLLKGVGSVYERVSDTAEWRKVHDFGLKDDFMVRHELTDRWRFSINNLFERRLEKETGSLLYTTGDKSVRLSVWNDKGKTKDIIYKRCIERVNTRDESRNKTLEKYDFSDDKVFRTGYRIKESDSHREYNVIYASSIINEELLQAALYFDSEEDMQWAIGTWQSMTID